MDELTEILKSNDIEVLKRALQDLIVLFEKQNRNYSELKQQVVKMKKPIKLIYKHFDDIDIDPESNSPIEPNDCLIETAIQTLSSIRLARKLQSQSNQTIARDLQSILDQEEMTQSQLSSVFEE